MTDWASYFSLLPSLQCNNLSVTILSHSPNARLMGPPNPEPRAPKTVSKSKTFLIKQLPSGICYRSEKPHIRDFECFLLIWKG